MIDNKFGNKKPKNKYEPKGLEILFEDNYIIVVNKSHGLLTISNDREKEKTAYFLLTDYVKKGNYRSKNRVFIVHRLDKETSGLLVFAKTEKAKFFLQENWKLFNKKYFAVAQGNMVQNVGIFSSYLIENKIHKMYSTSDKQNGKFSKTGYKVIKQSQNYCLLEIELFTGRKNQIRVHFSENGNPIAGDKIYGSNNKNIKRLALHSGYLKIIHPFTKKEMIFETGVPRYFKLILKN